jgi:hypothetical protein
MARQHLDHTGNEDKSVWIGKLNDMFVELYAAAQSAVSAVTGVFSGLITGGSLKLDTGTKTASATAGAATLAKSSGIITSEALTTAAGAIYTLTITNTAVAAADIAFASAANGTNSQGWLHVERVTPGAGSLVVVVRNIHASEALNGTIKIAFAVLKA